MKNKKLEALKGKMILANLKEVKLGKLQIKGGPEVELKAAAEGESEDSAKKFSMIAYTGGAMNVGYGDPVVVDLEGLDISNQRRPIFRDHSPEKIAGHTETIKVINGELHAEGLLSASNEHSEEIIKSSSKGFPWQASIGANPEHLAFVDQDEKVDVNGQTLEGPLIVATKSTLKEISFVPLGADDQTVSTVLASDNNNKQLLGAYSMKFKEWVKLTFGLDLDTLSDDQKALFKAQYEEANAGGNEPAPTKPVQAKAGQGEDVVKQIRADAQAEAQRIAAINKLDCLDAEKGDEIKAKAIGDNWNLEKTELELLKASRNTAPNVSVPSNGGSSLEFAEEALAITAGLPDIEKAYDAERLQKAQDKHKAGLTLQEVIRAAAYKNGHKGSGIFRDRSEHRAMLKAAFSTLEVSGILSNVSNKSLLAGYNAVEDSWRSVAATRSVVDFKEVTSYRMTGDNKYNKLDPQGQIEHGTLGEEEYGNKADTYAKMLSISRTDMVNDDLGAFSDIPRILGRGAALKLNEVLWAEFQKAGFWDATNKNVITGPTSALSINALNLAVKNIRDQKDADGNPLGAMADRLIVPTALEATALNIFESTNVNETTPEGEPSGDRNIHSGKYNPIVSSYLTSADAWFLLVNPADIAVIEACFLNGQQNPTIDSADADFDRLGVQMRGYHDFGVRQQDPRGGCRAAGA